MRTVFHRTAFWIALVSIALLGGQTVRASVGFTITPSLVSNTYSAPITLQVTGLSAGDTVVVQKFIDANTNGIIDAADTLVQQFNLTDGSNFVIAGITNNNVPGDTDSIAGQITARQNFQTDFSQTVVGNYLFKLSSPAGHFTAITNSFMVTNFPYAQKLSGTVMSDGVPVPYAGVTLFQPTSGSDNGLNPLGGTVANSAGIYTIAVPVGTYVLAAFKSNYVADTTAAANLVLGVGATLATNLNLIATTQSISGVAYDTNTPGIALPGMTIAVQTKAGLLALCFTDTNGNFSAGVNSNSWKVNADSASLALHGYLGLENKLQVSTAAGSVSGVTMALPKATAFFYGTVKDSFGNLLTGEVAVYVDDQNATNNYNGSYQSDGYTDTNGNFVVGVVGSSNPNEFWQVSIDNASSFPEDDFSQPFFDQNGGTNVVVGQVTMANITALLATNFITGQVTFNGAPVTNLQVNAYSEDTNNYQAQSTTDGNGNFSLQVGNNIWNVNVNCQGNNNSLDSILGSGNYQCPCGVNVTISNNNAATNIVVGGGGSGEIFGSVTNTTGNPIVGVNVSASDCNGDYYSATTGDNGSYTIDLPNGVWDVNVDCNSLNSQGYNCVNDQYVTVAGNDVEQDFVATSSGSGGGPLTIGTGFLPDDLVSNFYSQQLYASGGQTPYSWSLTPGSLALPPGLDLSTSGFITGTPTAMAVGTNYFSVRVTDNTDTTADQLLSITIYPALVMSSNNLPNGTIGTAYNAQILASGGDDSYGYSYNVIGTLPGGLILSQGATTSSNEVFIISGTPTNSGSFMFTLQIYDLDENEVQNNYSIYVASSSLQITTTSLANATAGGAYSYQLQGSGGTAPYTWTIANGSQPLPSALTLATNGLISGVPTTSGTNSFIVRITDRNSLTTTKALSLVINPKPVLSLSKWATNQFQMLLTGASHQNYTVQVTTNLSSTNWNLLLITNNTTTNSFLVADPNATNKQRFYRILIGP
jgi:hypothetical protein